MPTTKFASPDTFRCDFVKAQWSRDRGVASGMVSIGHADYISLRGSCCTVPIRKRESLHSAAEAVHNSGQTLKSEDNSDAKAAGDNLVWGFNPCMFCTSVCFYLHFNQFNLNGFQVQLSVMEDQSFCILQADLCGQVSVQMSSILKQGTPHPH